MNADDITAAQWRRYHRRRGTWKDAAAVQAYLKQQQPSPFAMRFGRWAELFMGYYNRQFGSYFWDEWGNKRWFQPFTIQVDDGSGYYFGVTTEALVNIHRRGALPSQAARDYYEAACQAEDADAREHARISREWRNFAATGDPEVSPEKYYKYDGVSYA